MKPLFFFFLFIFSCLFISAQLKVTPVCPPFAVDVMAGNVNKLYPKSGLGEIQKAFPCFSEVVEVATEARCEGIFYKDYGLSFYTARNYIEIGETYKGKMTPALLGTNRSDLFKLLGYPKLKDAGWDAFQMEYGTLVLYYDKDGKINKLQIASKSTDALKLCD